MDAPLSDVEVRVLGALLEKERTTPDAYPLSLNALAAACSQTSNRDPVMALDEPTVAAAIDRLRRRSLVRAFVHSGGRVTKYGHLMGDALGLVGRQLAVLDVLMLRGPQTAGEIRTRAQRLHAFEDVADVEATLDGLIAHEPAPLVVRLPRRPGQKEVRYAHLLAGELAAAAADASDPGPVGEPLDAPDARPARRPDPRSAGAADDRVEALEAALAALRQEVADLRGELAAFRRQFE